MIGSLLYVTTSRPDVMHTVGQVAFPDISKGRKSLDYGIQKKRIYLLLPTQMQIG